MKRLNKFLTDSFRQWEFTEKEGCFILWIALAAFLTLFIGQFVFHRVELLFSIFCLGVTFVPPIVAGVYALVKKEKFNPLWWFHSVRGLVYGGLFACLVLFVIRGVMAILSVFQ